MNLVVNNRQIPIYDPDTSETIINRIASLFNTLPKYVFLDTSVPSEHPVNMINLLDTIRNINTLDIKEVIEEIHKYNPALKSKEDILYPWLTENRYINELLSQLSIADSIKFSLQQNVSPYLDEDEFENFWKFIRDSVSKNLQKEIERNRRKDQQLQNEYKQFSEIQEGLLFTPFMMEKVDINIVFKHNKLAILELFDSAIVTEYCPIIQCQDFIKIHKQSLIIDEWIYEHEPNIVLRLYTRQYQEDSKTEDFVEVRAIAYDTVEGNITFETTLNTSRGYLTIQQFTERLEKVFNLSQGQVVEKRTSGVFFFPDRYLDSYVFSDLVMNDKIFSMLNIDESGKATKKKSKEGQSWLYLNFSGDITATINQRYTDRSDPDLRNLNYLHKDYADLFLVGSPYIRVYAKANNSKQMERFQTILSKLLVIYLEKEKDIIDIYRNLLNDTNFATVFEPVIEQKSTRADIASPDICVKNYSRNCTETRIPFVVSEEDAKQYEHSMKFPRDKGTIPSDGKDQKYYVCLDPVFKYPGIQVNKLENKTDYPYVPCCFKKSMDNNSIYRHYFYDEPLEEKQARKQQDIVVTDKILMTDKFGVLPDNIKRLLNLMDYKANYEYIRLGVERNRTSLLHAVTLALHEQTKILKEKNKEARILELRKEMTDESIISLCRQCRYDANVHQIKEDLLNNNTYLDPKLYIPMLERIYDCTIFLFNPDSLVIPRHLQHYYQFKKPEENKPVVLIYEHLGSEADHAEYPQCELIIRWKIQSTETQYSFTSKDPLHNALSNIFDKLVEGYQLNRRISRIDFPLERKVKKYIINQTLDTFGKARQLTILYNDKKVTLFTSPMPPLPVKEAKIPKIYKVDLKIAQKLLEKWGYVYAQVVPDNYIQELVGRIGDVDISIPVIETSPLQNIKILKTVSYGDKHSILEEYHKKKKYAYFLQEYSKWLFSKYNEGSEITDETIQNFMNEKIKIILDYPYGEIEQRFVMDGGVMKNGKLILHNHEVQKRLIYSLKLYSIRNKQELSTYYEKEKIPSYYDSVIDFQKHNNQLLVQGKAVVRQWLQERTDLYNLQTKVVVGIQRPYFFYNTNISDKVYLAQNIDTLPKAMDIAVKWNEKQYNTSLEAKTHSIVPFTLYKYVNEHNIQKENVEGGSDINILGYKVENKPTYTVLLPLS